MITFRKMEHSLVGVVDGKPFNLPRTDYTLSELEVLQSNPESTVEDVMELVENSRGVVIAATNKYLVFNPITRAYFLSYQGSVSTYPIPSSLVEYIETSFDKDIDFMPVIKAWARLLANPRINKDMIAWFNTYLDTMYVDSTQVDTLVEEGYALFEAAAMSTYPDIAITQEGLLATYKVAEMVTWKYTMEEDEDGNWTKKRNTKYDWVPAVLDEVTGVVITPGYQDLPEFKEDILFTPAICKSGDKFFSGTKLGYVYEVGKVQQLPANAKRNLSNNFGGGGLYIGGLNYVKGFNNEDTEVLTCFVNPGDILSFQSEGHAIRVDALMPNNVWLESVKLKGMYHSSDYSTLSEDRLNDLIEEAVNNGVHVGEEFIAMQEALEGDNDENFGTVNTKGSDDDIDQDIDDALDSFL